MTTEFQSIKFSIVERVPHHIYAGYEEATRTARKKPIAIPMAKM
jgi:hypothetical protein